MKPRDPETYDIIGAAMEVHRVLGHGFLEAVYQEALEHELVLRGIPFIAQAELPISYKGRALQCSYRADLLCFDSLIVELKALSSLTSAHDAQVLNYLKATGLQRGLLLNFGTASLEHKRLVNSPSLHSAEAAADLSLSL